MPASPPSLSGSVRPVTVRMPVRAPRLGVLVPTSSPWPWQRCFEAALAHRTGKWGGVGDLVFPLEPGLAEHELFWRIADVFDADAYVVDELMGLDLPEIDPVAWMGQLAELRDRFPDLDDQALENHVAGATLLSGSISADMHRLLVRRLAPLHLELAENELHDSVIETGYVPEMDVGDLAELPREIRNARTTLGPSQSLLLTAELGRLDRGTEATLVQRGLAVHAEDLESSVALAARLYSNSGQQGVWPWTLSQQALSIYARARMRRSAPVVVAGDDVWDFVLFYALRKLTMRAWWVPSEVETDPVLSNRFQHRIQFFSRQQALPIHVVSFSSPLSQAGFDGDLEAGTICPGGSRGSVDVSSEEVSARVA